MKTPHLPFDQQTNSKKELLRLLLEVQHELMKYSTANAYQQEIRSELESMNTLIDILSERIINEPKG